MESVEWNSRITSATPGANMDEARGLIRSLNRFLTIYIKNVTYVMKVLKAIKTNWRIFFHVGQLNGFS